MIINKIKNICSKKISNIEHLLHVLKLGLSKKERLILVLIGVISGLMEMMSVGIIIDIGQNYLDNNSPAALGIKFSNWSYVFILSGFILLIKFLINTLSMRIQANTIFNSIKSLSTKLLGTYLNGPIEDVYGNGNGIAIRNVFNECTLLGISVYLPIAIIISEIIISTLLLIYLFLINPLLITPNLIAIILSILLLWLPIKNILPKIGRKRQEGEAERLQLTSDTLKILPDIKTQNLIENFLTSYFSKTEKSTSSQAAFQFWKQLPRVSAEMIMVASFLISFLSFSILGILDQIKIGEIGGLLFVLYRLFPAITRISANISQINYSWSAANAINERYKKILVTKIRYESEFNLLNIKSIKWGAILDNKRPYCLESLEIEEGICLLKGASGSGKTSLLLGLCGLNKNIQVEEKSSNDKNMRNYVNDISFTSQCTILTGDTIQEAIIAGRSVNLEVLNNFDKFISHCFTDINLNNSIISLSGGQIKVIAFLRSLYSDKKIHLFDEIFSGVDRITARKCIKFLRKEYKEKVFIISDHNTLNISDTDKAITLC
tara:strand:+ start:2367 stop:4013 length:1647 start_codon:yes stop_codon:yes gene_type:complete